MFIFNIRVASLIPHEELKMYAETKSSVSKEDIAVGEGHSDITDDSIVCRGLLPL